MNKEPFNDNFSRALLDFSMYMQVFKNNKFDF